MEQIQESSQYPVLMQGAIGAVTLITYNVSMSTLRIAGFHWYKPAILMVSLSNRHVIIMQLSLVSLVSLLALVRLVSLVSLNQ